MLLSFLTFSKKLILESNLIWVLLYYFNFKFFTFLNLYKPNTEAIANIAITIYVFSPVCANGFLDVVVSFGFSSLALATFFTVTVQVAVLPSEAVAIIFVVPSEIAVTFPFSTLAIFSFSLFHVTVLSVISVEFIVAINVAEFPSSNDNVVLSNVIIFFFSSSLSFLLLTP